ncbi:hypothetical protein R5R35_006850 [Gryllus longicercus]|uniref:Uncharacterized protein n=1 Tax=Gryllus longicercus TaxID=2509291 RepID=A0AAN9V6L8_9ORTH
MAWGFRKLQMVRPGGGKDWKRFLVFSALAWGLSSLMTGLCAILHENDDEKRRRFSPSLTETRTCFNEVIISTDPNDVYVSTYQSGTALFYYGPVCVLTVLNAICIERTVRKVQFLRRGNSVLHREEDKAAQTPRRTDGENAPGHNSRTNKEARSTIADAKTIRLYAKIFLMTGVIDIISEIIGWATIPSHRVLVTNSLQYYNKYFFLQEHMMAYRATGHATDCFRAACVVWLAAPDGGYFGALRQRLGFSERGRGDGRPPAGRP